jgi:TPR repeat protein
VQAASWYRKAAEQGYSPAEFSLGLFYVHGWGVPQDYTQALVWYSKAAEQNNPNALVNMALLYHEGKGVKKNEEQALDYIHRAAEAGAPDAQFQMGMDYDGGYHGLKQDKALAAEWFRKAAEQGMTVAQYDLVMEIHDQHDETYFWISVAIPNLKGDMLKNATNIRELAASYLQPDQRAMLDERIKQWQATHPQPSQ